ncbi:hypothetical protein ACF0H5_020154 [Mactra antiquata]
MRQSILVLGFVLAGVCCLKNMVIDDISKRGGVTYKVTLHVYSGREDPKWEIDHTSPHYARIAKAFKSVKSTPLCKHLGYRGFLVETTLRSGRKRSWTFGCDKHRDIADMLLKSSPFSLDACAKAAVKGKVHPRHEQPTKSKPKTKRLVSNIPCSTLYEPDVWNQDPGIRLRNNCYNYATNRQTNTFAQPGRASGVDIHGHIYVNFVYDACLSDGLTALSGPSPGDECLIVLVIWPGCDFHFYRRDQDLYWSHKPGSTPVINTDASGALIQNIETADHGLYTDFGGYLGVGSDIHINLTTIM